MNKRVEKSPIDLTRELVIYNAGPDVIYVGTEMGNTDAAYPIDPGETLPIEVKLYLFGGQAEVHIGEKNERDTGEGNLDQMAGPSHTTKSNRSKAGQSGYASKSGGNGSRRRKRGSRGGKGRRKPKQTG